MKARILGGPAVAAAALVLGGCSTLDYYVQSVTGHLALMADRRPIDQLIRAPDTPPELRRRLEEVTAIRDFASRALLLPDNASYRSYVDPGRRFLVWTVVATPEFSLAPLTWCFPVVGCVSYRGYYDEARAERFAGSLRGRGLDVAVSGVRAYSTLGWFDDPVPRTILDGPGHRTAATIFHELAHQMLYVAGDSAFNEAFAVVVEREGVRRWLQAHGSADEQASFAREEERERVFLGLLEEARGALGRVYASDAPDADKRRDKQQVFEALRVRHASASAGWSEGPRYDAWFDDDLDNAKLASIATYHALAPAFEALLGRSGGDLAAFYAECERLAALPAGERHARLQ